METICTDLRERSELKEAQVESSELRRACGPHKERGLIESPYAASEQC